MEDLARLGVVHRIVGVRLQVGEREQRVPGELAAEREGLQAGDDRVASEDGHEPRHARGDQASAGHALDLHPQSGQVDDRLLVGESQVAPRARESGHGGLPGALRVLDAGDTEVELAPCFGLPGHDELRARDDVDREAPLLARRELDRPRQPRAVGLGGTREEDVRSQLCVVGIAEDQHRAVVARSGGDGRRQRAGVQRVAELHVALLDREDVGEVHLELEADGEPLRLRGEIADRDVLQQSDRDAPLTHHEEVVVAQPVRERIPEEEGRPVRDVVTAGEELRRSVVEGEDEARKVTRIAGEEPECALAHVAPVVRDAEVRAGENSQRHRRSSIGAAPDYTRRSLSGSRPRAGRARRRRAGVARSPGRMRGRSSAAAAHRPPREQGGTGR